MSEAEAQPFTEKRWLEFKITPPPEGVEIEIAEDGALWRIKPRKVVQVFQSAPDPEADARRLAKKQDEQLEREAIEWAKAQYLAQKGRAK